MLTTLTLAALFVVAPAPEPVGLFCLDASATRDDTLRDLYRGGRTYADFLADATRRRELWDENTEKARTIHADLIERARAVGGTWRVLVIAVDACSDSVSTIPYIAGLVARVEGLDLRIVDSTAGRAVMEAHPTPDGRAATPTVVLLDSDWNEAGCFIERPKSLQTWIRENRGRLSTAEVFSGKMEWYADDGGRETLEELVAILEAAASGDHVCGS